MLQIDCEALFFGCQVFYGPAVSDTVDVSCTSGNSDSCSAPITASNGEVMIRFKSDARNGDASERLGFCVKYSVGEISFYV